MGFEANLPIIGMFGWAFEADKSIDSCPCVLLRVEVLDGYMIDVSHFTQIA